MPPERFLPLFQSSGTTPFLEEPQLKPLMTLTLLQPDPKVLLRKFPQATERAVVHQSLPPREYTTSRGTLPPWGHCLHGEGSHQPLSCCHGQSRKVRKRKYYLPVASEELKQLLESLIRFSVKLEPCCSYTLSFSRPLSVKWMISSPWHQFRSESAKHTQYFIYSATEICR